MTNLQLYSDLNVMPHAITLLADDQTGSDLEYFLQKAIHDLNRVVDKGETKELVIINIWGSILRQ